MAVLKRHRHGGWAVLGVLPMLLGACSAADTEQASPAGDSAPPDEVSVEDLAAAACVGSANDEGNPYGGMSANFRCDAYTFIQIWPSSESLDVYLSGAGCPDNGGYAVVGDSWLVKGMTRPELATAVADLGGTPC